jgi:prophage DNA circulation protein
MADLWEEIMQDGSLGGIVLPIARRGFVLGRAGARVRLPYQPGQAVEDTGREPFTFKLQVELFADIDPDHYPGRYEELLELLTDEDRKGEVEYVDPMLGPFDVKVWQVDGDEVSESRNGVTLNLVLEEVSLTARGFTVEQRPSPEAEAAEAGEEMDAQLEELGVEQEQIDAAFNDAGAPRTGDEKEWDAGTTGSSMAAAFSEGLAEGLQTADEIASRVDTVRRRVSAITSLVEVRVAQAWGAYAAALQLADALSRVGDEALARAVPMVEMRITAPTSHYDLALQLYGDPARAAEIVRRNSFRNPLFIAPGTVVRVAVR